MKIFLNELFFVQKEAMWDKLYKTLIVSCFSPVILILSILIALFIPFFRKLSVFPTIISIIIPIFILILLALGALLAITQKKIKAYNKALCFFVLGLPMVFALLVCIPFFGARVFLFLYLGTTIAWVTFILSFTIILTLKICNRLKNQVTKAKKTHKTIINVKTLSIMLLTSLYWIGAILIGKFIVAVSDIV